MFMDFSNSVNTFIRNTAFCSKFDNFWFTSLSKRLIISWLMTSAERPDLGLFSREFRLFCWPPCHCGILWATITIHISHAPMVFFGVCTLLVRNFMTTLNSIIWLSIFACGYKCIGIQTKVRSEENVCVKLNSCYHSTDKGLHCTKLICNRKLPSSTNLLNCPPIF